MDHDFALDGDATLEAALQFISDCDFGHELEAVDSQSYVDENGVFTSNGTPSSSSEASDAQPANIPARGKKRRPVEELRELRKQEYELSAKVAALRLQARDKLSRQRLQDGVASVDECSGFWERVAARQREYRTRAEAENERLRTIVSAQIEKARRMRQTWLKRTQPTLETLGTFGAENAPSIPEDNDAVFAKLLDGIEEDCEVALQALASERREPSSKRVARSSKIQVNKEYRGDGDVLMEYFADASMPFSREAVASAAWQAFTRERSYRNPSFHRDLVDASDSEIKSSASLEIKLPMFGLFVRIRLVARRIVEEDHTVIVVKTFVEPKSLADRQGIGLVCYETFVRVISVGRKATSARVETFATLRGKVLDGPNAEFWRRDFNVHVAKMVWSHAQASRAEILENILIEDAVIMPKE